MDRLSLPACPKGAAAQQSFRIGVRERRLVSL